MTSSVDYSSAGEPANLHFSYAGSTFLESLVRDAVGRIVGRSETVEGVTTTYAYRFDAAGRLYGVTTNGDTTARYLYGPNGNRLSFANPQSAGDTATATYDAQDRLLRYADTTYAYTAAGELTQKISGTGTTNYTYDLLGNLITVVLPNQTRIDYVIDGQNRRVGRKVNGTLVQGWLYQDGLRPVAELDGAGSVVARYVWGSRANVPDYVVKADTTYRIVADHLGSVRLVVEVSGGTVARRVSYDAYGRVMEDTSPGFTTSVQRHPVLRDKATPSLAHPPSGEQRFGLRLRDQPPF